MKKKSIGGISLILTINSQGVQYLLGIFTNLRIFISHFTELKMTKDVIDQVYEFSRQNNADTYLTL